MEKYIVEDRSDEHGKQFIYRFPNGYGASVIKNAISYGGDEGMWEVGVLKFQANKWYLDYTTSITNDVIGYLDFDGVENVLQQIKNLDNETGCTRCESLAIEDGIREAKKMLAGLDMVNHPPHYNHGKFEVVEVIKDWKLNFNLGSVIKYIARADHKGNREQDLQKALWYLKKEIEDGL